MAEETKAEECPVEIGEVYWHIGNSGVKFRVIDEGFGPTIEINTNAFSNIDQTLKIMTSAGSLQSLIDLLTKARDHQGYSKTYCHAALTEEESDRIRAEYLKEHPDLEKACEVGA